MYIVRPLYILTKIVYMTAKNSSNKNKSSALKREKPWGRGWSRYTWRYYKNWPSLAKLSFPTNRSKNIQTHYSSKRDSWM